MAAVYNFFCELSSLGSGVEVPSLLLERVSVPPYPLPPPPRENQVYDRGTTLPQTWKLDVVQCNWKRRDLAEWFKWLTYKYTVKKENKIFLIYQEIQNGAVAKSYTYIWLTASSYMAKYLGISSYITLQLLHFLNFLIHEKNFWWLQTERNRREKNNAVWLSALKLWKSAPRSRGRNTTSPTL